MQQKTVSVLFSLVLLSSWAVGQTSSKQPIQRDWFKQDPYADSIAGISLNKAYELLKGRKSKTVIVAVIDNGVDITHEDLKNIVWTNKKEIPDNGVDDDNNGYVDDIHGWNFRGTKDGTIVQDEQSGSTQFYLACRTKFETLKPDEIKPSEKAGYDNYVRARKDYLEKQSSKDSVEKQFTYNADFHSCNLISNDSPDSKSRFYGSPVIKLTPNTTHGTHVAGIIAAKRDNNVGVDGIADNVLIMPIVATTVTGDERDKDIANAIIYAVDNGANIINMSFSKLFSSEKDLIDNAIKYAEKKNVLIFHAAGNDGADIDSAINYHYPIAIYNNGSRASNFVTVGWNRALFDYRLAHPYGNYGKLNVDLLAPGSDIYSCVPNNQYDFKSATSMSTPMVSGVAALLYSYFPNLTMKQIKDIILKSTFRPNQIVNKPQTKIQVQFNTLSVTGGIVNAYDAIKLAMEISGK